MKKIVTGMLLSTSFFLFVAAESSKGCGASQNDVCSTLSEADCKDKCEVVTVVRADGTGAQVCQDKEVATIKKLNTKGEVAADLKLSTSGLPTDIATLKASLQTAMDDRAALNSNPAVDMDSLEKAVTDATKKVTDLEAKDTNTKADLKTAEELVASFDTCKDIAESECAADERKEKCEFDKDNGCIPIQTALEAASTKVSELKNALSDLPGNLDLAKKAQTDAQEALTAAKGQEVKKAADPDAIADADKAVEDAKAALINAMMSVQ